MCAAKWRNVSDTLGQKFALGCTETFCHFAKTSKSPIELINIRVWLMNTVRAESADRWKCVCLRGVQAMHTLGPGGGPGLSRPSAVGAWRSLRSVQAERTWGAESISLSNKVRRPLG